MLGDTASGKRDVVLAPGLIVSFGDLTAISGDLFESPEQIRALASDPATVAQVRYALEVKVWKTKQDKDFSPDVGREVNKRYLELAGKNVTHFSNPDVGDEKLSEDEKAKKRSGAGTPMNNEGGYRANHEKAIIYAFVAGQTGDPMDTALLCEGFASHFLTDSYSAGHLRTARAGISAWWNPKVPMFWENLKMWMAEKIAKYIREHPSQLSHLTPQILMEQGQVALMENLEENQIPDLTFGDAMAGALHDVDNLQGVDATVGAEKVRLVGDGQLVDDKDKEVLAGAATKAKAVAGLKVSLKDLDDAQAAGKGTKAGPLDSQSVLAKLRTPAGIFRAEQLWPQAIPDASPGQSNKSAPWKVDTIDELFANPAIRKAITRFANEKAATLQDTIHLKGPLGIGAIKQEAFLKSVIATLHGDEATVMSAFRDIVDYVPGSVTASPAAPQGELGGVKGSDRDDNAVAYYLKAKEKGALTSLSLAQRTKLLVDVLDGATVGNEITMIHDLLASAGTQLKPVLDAIGWARVYSKLYGDDCLRLVRDFGPEYWGASTFEQKKAEVKRLSGGRTNAIGQEAMIVILRTCGSDEVRKIDKEAGGRMGLSWDLDGHWNKELKVLEGAR
ncbi:MAG: hypothetical protein NVSMB32_01170 [Actinomycetota bacterium]